MAKTVGAVLRSARESRALTLRDVGTRSRGRFKASALGGYERGERTISLERFIELARLYGIPADRLLAEILGAMSPEGRIEVVIDLTKLPEISGDTGRAVTEFVHEIRIRRGDYVTDVITLRSGDLESLALSTRLEPGELLRRLDPVLVLPGA